MKVFPNKKRLIIYLVIALFLYLVWTVWTGATSSRGPLILSEEEKSSYKVLDKDALKQQIDEYKKQKAKE